MGKKEVVGERGEEENVSRGKDRIRGCRLREAFHVFTSLERFEAGERLILGEINLFLEGQINVLKIKLKKLEIFVNKSCFYSIRISLLSKLMAEEQRGRRSLLKIIISARVTRGKEGGLSKRCVHNNRVSSENNNVYGRKRHGSEMQLDLDGR